MIGMLVIPTSFLKVGLFYQKPQKTSLPGPEAILKSLVQLSLLSVMGQFLGRPKAGVKANHEPEEAPEFPDYMLDPDAVVSLSALVSVAGVGGCTRKA